MSAPRGKIKYCLAGPVHWMISSLIKSGAGVCKSPESRNMESSCASEVFDSDIQHLCRHVQPCSDFYRLELKQINNTYTSFGLFFHECLNHDLKHKFALSSFSLFLNS